jgi:hypothetical protein
MDPVLTFNAFKGGLEDPSIFRLSGQSFERQLAVFASKPFCSGAKSSRRTNKAELLAGALIALPLSRDLNCFAAETRRPGHRH